MKNQAWKMGGDQKRSAHWIHNVVSQEQTLRTALTLLLLQPEHCSTPLPPPVPFAGYHHWHHCHWALDVAITIAL